MAPLMPDGGFNMDDAEPRRYSPVCTRCAHHGDVPGTCKAFPDGIPDEIWDGRNPHTSPVRGDHGIQFLKA